MKIATLIKTVVLIFIVMLLFIPFTSVSATTPRPTKEAPTETIQPAPTNTKEPDPTPTDQPTNTPEPATSTPTTVVDTPTAATLTVTVLPEMPEGYYTMPQTGIMENFLYMIVVGIALLLLIFVVGYIRRRQ